MSTTRKCYFHAKRGMAPRVPCQRPRSKSSELFDEVVGGEAADLEAPPLPTRGVNTMWSSQQDKSAHGKDRVKKPKKKELRSDDKINYRGTVYKCSPFCPSPVKPSSHPNQDMLVSMDTVSMETNADQNMDTEDVFETKLPPATTTSIADEEDSSSRMRSLTNRNSNKSRSKAANLKVFDFDLDDSDGSMGPEVKEGAVSDKAASKPPSGAAVATGNARKYNTIKTLGRRKLTMSAGGKGQRVRKKGDQDTKGGGSRRVAKEVGEKCVVEVDVEGATEAQEKGKVEEKADGGRHGNSCHGDTKSAISHQVEKRLLTDLVSSSQPNSPDSNTKTTKTVENVSRKLHSNSNSKKAGRLELNTKTDVTRNKTGVVSGNLTSDVREVWMEEASHSGAPSRIPANVLDLNSHAELPGQVKPVSSVSAGGKSGNSNVRQSTKVATATEKKITFHRYISASSQASHSLSKSRVPATIQALEVKNLEGSIEDKQLADLSSFGDVEEPDSSRVNGLWPRPESSKPPRGGKRKRAWLVERNEEEEESTDSADPYAFDFSEGTNSPAKTGGRVEPKGAKTGSGSGSKKLPESNTRRTDYSKKKTVAVEKSSQKIDSDVLCEIDAMLEGYEDGNNEEEDITSRLSPDLTPANPKVGKLKKNVSEGHGKSRRYAYTARQAPGPSEVGGAVPRLKKSLTWPRRPKRGPDDLKTASPLLSVGHTQSMESGETRQFFEEIHYLLDSMKSCRPVHTRCLSTCNLASQFLDSDFSRQVRAHDFTEKIVAVLQDSVEIQSLCVCASVLFYVMTRDKLCTNLGEGGVNLLVDMLTTPACDQEQLEGREARDWQKVQEQARGVLEQVADHTSQGINTPPPEEEEDEDLVPLSQPMTSSQEVDDRKSNRKRHGFRVATDDISPAELARECIITLSAPQNDPQKLREDLRTRGALDHLANMVITSCEELSSRDYNRPETLTNEMIHSISRQACVLDRQLKSIEHLTLMNKSNQSYLVIFDGSVLVSRLSQFLEVGHVWLDNPVLRSSGQVCMLAVLKILINLTHESDLGSHRLGEQKNIMNYILNIILRCPAEVSESDKFDLSIMALILVINLIEHSTTNCHKLESVSLDSLKGSQSDVATPPQGGSGMTCNGAVAPRGSVLTVLVQMFLNLCDKADSTVINVPTPQRLSQISSNSSPSSQTSNKPQSSSQGSSPGKALATNKRGGASCKADLSTRLSNNVKGYSSNRAKDMEVSSSQESPHPLGQVARADKKVVASSSRVGVVSDDEEEECEPIEMDALVFDRDEYNSALDQAGRQMEDSLLSSYLALVLGIVAEKDFDMVDVIRDLMPSRSFSEMLKMLKKFVSFMSMTGSDVGLESIKHTIKYLEAIQPRT